MQRRAVAPSAGGGGSPSSSSFPGPAGGGRRGVTSNNSFSGKRKVFSRTNGSTTICGGLRPVVFLMVFAVGLFVVSWILFPAEVMEVEHQAVLEGQKIANAAKRAERRVEDWWEQAEEKFKDHEDPASAIMASQSSTWVDGEKKLKKKLQVLYEKQLKGEMLGVPVLTRWLGEDVPAYLEPGMDEEEWKRTVDRRYAEMAEEEEQWKKEMAKIVEDRERDLGIVTI